MADDGFNALVIIGLGVVALYILSKTTGSNTASLVQGEGEFPSTPPGSLTGLLDTAWNSVFPQNLSPDGAAFIQTQEGLQLTAYPDAGGYSIGYGHHINGTEAQIIGQSLGPGSTITPAQANALFQSDVSAAVAAVNSAVGVPLTQNQFDALVDFTFNEGVGAFENSTLLQLLNSGNYEGAAAQFAQWNLSGGTVNQALVARRAAEAGLFA